ncbi:uncharacterized protein TRIADDRAFT_55626 [Trichoplax adhaerens]|uniref:Carbamoyltransferase n=1 Tax=Trichoplax adhaerens TaxID=10228 RepID=B3RVE7_TRIAD|nr:hypothetical protein TRIADDRAFT_55626 [Trichoplax adhaerens]EDV25487.1 hypothetical protein TRIADDRAFT_55626 [Trichoplax adhaerens]|eukprot:XP_002111520.1 hypothetical protein TRIADDRAFT_55626 [Trichoplax adhaerens]
MAMYKTQLLSQVIYKSEMLLGLLIVNRLILSLAVLIIHESKLDVLNHALYILGLFQVRYFCSAPKNAQFREQWEKAIDEVTKYTGIHHFDVAVTSWVMPSKRLILQELIECDKWIAVDHHLCHATLGFYDSPFQNALILSYDGGGNDGTFNIYSGTRKDYKIQLIKKIGLNLGTPYRQLATCMPEVTGKTFSNDEPTNYMRFAPLALSGKVMGYAALGKVRKEWHQELSDYYKWFVTPLQAIFSLGDQLNLNLEPNALDNENARDLAASSQKVFEELLCAEVNKCLCTLRETGQDIDGIVLTGGCALNVNANYEVAKDFGYPVHVPSAPNDCGISIGAAWQVTPPIQHFPTQYCGLPLHGLDSLTKLAQERNARVVTITELAEIIANGAIIGIARGRQEFGPRALGHRSIVCYPNKQELKDKINRLKSRQWFRPLCPSVTVECARDIFEVCSSSEGAVVKSCISSNGSKGWIPASPYMSFAVPLTAQAKEMFPAISHFDGTARLQTVSNEDEPWYHSLLVAIGQKTNGKEILLNTSFNVKGKPILNNVNTALEILDNNQSDTLDYVLIEDYLFQKSL